MIIIPELEIVVILVPRTGSTSLKYAIFDKYRNSFMPYRHMEADGVPRGYERWSKVGVIRHPLERLWSLYKKLKTIDGPHEAQYIDRMRKSVDCSFDDYILYNEIPLTSPYSFEKPNKFFPQYYVSHHLPENRKSQFIYLRPDLGTKVYKLNKIDYLLEKLGLGKLLITNNSDNTPVPEISNDAINHMIKNFIWDYTFFPIKPHT